MRRPPPARTALLGGALVATSALAGCSPADMMPEPISEQGDAVIGLWSPAVIAALVVGSVVWGLITVSVIRYRRRNDSLPTQVEEHIPIEIAYTVIPILIVVALFAAGSVTYRDVTGAPSDPEMTVRVTGFQWSWELAYEGTDVVVDGTGEGTDGPILVLPADRTTRLQLVSRDVIHSFWVPELLVKRDLVPGIDNHLDVTPTRTGTFRGRCAEFCGYDHWRMYLQLRVLPPAEFDAWLAEQGGGR